jgi:beta-1,4-mannooligosaccharide/beta-1,4-mannosyl-N-acetylglucosamine phosphorylase
MSKVKIIGEALKNIPWQEKPEGYEGIVWRHDSNPIIDKNPSKTIVRIYNSAVLPYGDGFVGVFRADHRNALPHLYFGKSKDGLKWEIEEEKIKWMDIEGKPFDPKYAYDPRLVKIEDTYYIIFCTDFGGAPTLGLGITKDFKEFTRLENAFVPCNRNGVLFPKKFNEKFLLLNRPSDLGHTPFGDIYISESPDLIYWGRHRKVMTKGGSGWWQDLKIGPGPIPIETTEGWLLFYHGVVRTCNDYVYSMGAAILDIDNPSKVLYRTKGFILTPEEEYETVGYVPNVAFPCATLHDAETGRIALYYGAADTYTAVAYTRVDELIEYIKENSELVAGDAEEVR